MASGDIRAQGYFDVPSDVWSVYETIRGGEDRTVQSPATGAWPERGGPMTDHRLDRRDVLESDGCGCYWGGSILASSDCTGT